MNTVVSHRGGGHQWFQWYQYFFTYRGSIPANSINGRNTSNTFSHIEHLQGKIPPPAASMVSILAIPSDI